MIRSSITGTSTAMAVSVFLLAPGPAAHAASLGSIDIVQSDAPLGFFSISGLVGAIGCPADCDDGGFVFNVPAFAYAGAIHTSIIASVNGTVEVGQASNSTAPPTNSELPDPASPNNILAPLWTDLDLGTNIDTAFWFIGDFTLGSNRYTILEWSNAMVVGATGPSATVSFQVWIESMPAATDHSNIWFTYGNLSGLPANYTVGAEGPNGVLGDSYFFNGTGSAPPTDTDLRVAYTPPVIPLPAAGVLLVAGLSSFGLVRLRRG